MIVYTRTYMLMFMYQNERKFKYDVVYEIFDTAEYKTLQHRRRIYLEAKANSRQLFLGENGAPLRLFGSSVAALWTHTWKDAGLNLTENF